MLKYIYMNDESKEIQHINSIKRKNIYIIINTKIYKTILDNKILDKPILIKKTKIKLIPLKIKEDNKNHINEIIFIENGKFRIDQHENIDFLTIPNILNFKTIIKIYIYNNKVKEFTLTEHDEWKKINIKINNDKIDIYREAFINKINVNDIHIICNKQKKFNYKKVSRLYIHGIRNPDDEEDDVDNLYFIKGDESYLSDPKVYLIKNLSYYIFNFELFLYEYNNSKMNNNNNILKLNNKKNNYILTNNNNIKKYCYNSSFINKL